MLKILKGRVFKGFGFVDFQGEECVKILLLFDCGFLFFQVKRFGGSRGLPVTVPQAMEAFLLERIQIGKMIFMSLVLR